MTIRALIVDDEPLARSRLIRLLDALGIKDVSEAENGQQAVELVDKLPFDILFLDINMPIMNGLQAAQHISEKVVEPPAIVFCTAYDEYAIEAFKTKATSYLLKPVEPDELKAAIEKSADLSRLQISQLADKQGSKTIVVHYQGALQNIPLSKFAYFQSIEKNVFGRLDGGEDVLVDATLKSLEDELSDEFVRVHRNALVNREQASRLVRDDKGASRIELISDGVSLSVSRRHLSEVKKCFQ